MIFLLLIPAAVGLGIGCGAFILLAIIPWQRYRALGTALWLAAFGISTSAIFWLEMVAIGLLSGRSIEHLVHFDEIYSHHPGLALASVLIASAIVATAAALSHGIVVRRIIFNLFRLYASAVACGVGILSSLFIVWIVAANTEIVQPWLSLAAALLALPPLLTVITYRYAKDFRGARPVRWNPVTTEEYTSVP